MSGDPAADQDVPVGLHLLSGDPVTRQDALEVWAGTGWIFAPAAAISTRIPGTLLCFKD